MLRIKNRMSRMFPLLRAVNFHHQSESVTCHVRYKWRYNISLGATAAIMSESHHSLFTPERADSGGGISAPSRLIPDFSLLRPVNLERKIGRRIEIQASSQGFTLSFVRELENALG